MGFWLIEASTTLGGRWPRRANEELTVLFFFSFYLVFTLYPHCKSVGKELSMVWMSFFGKAKQSHIYFYPTHWRQWQAGSL